MHEWIVIDATGFWPRHRVDLGLPPATDQVEICRAWIREHCEPFPLRDAGPARDRNSYDWKHQVERDIDDDTRHVYVSNGAFIAAALYEGYRVRREEPGSPNAAIGMRSKRGHLDRQRRAWMRRGWLDE